MRDFASKSMIQSKNLKLKLGLCGLALTSFLALNSRSVVHADTVDSGNSNAITWDSDQDDSQVVKEDSNQSQPTQNAQEQAPAVQSVQSVQSNVQKRAEKSVVRVSNFDTSAVNRNNVDNQRNNANVKVATVHDTAQMPVQKQKVAQFNQGSKIYTLNGSNQLSKNNGDGYVITNAGTFNGRPVDIGVTINNVQNNQGSYTTKWSNGDKADTIGSVDNQFDYQNGVTLNSNAVNPVINSGQTHIRNRIENQNKTYQLGKVYVGIEVNDGRPGYYGYKDMYVLDPVDLAKELAKRKISPDNDTSVMKVAGEMLQPRGGEDAGFYDAAINNGKYVVHIGYNSIDGGGTYDDAYTLQGIPLSEFKAWFDKNKKDFVTHWSEGTGNDPGVADMGESDTLYIYNHMHDITGTKDVNDPFTAQPFDASDGTKLPVWKPYYKDTGVYNDATANCYSSDGDLVQDDDVLTPNEQNADLSIFGNDFVQNANYNFASPVEVTDHLQIDQVKNGSLNYDYTIGLYDAQTGDLITSLKPEYKNGVKVGKTATNQDTVMNNAIKNKIADINANKAAVAFNGTVANDDVAFYEETRQVNPQDKNVNRQVQRVIHINFPNGVKPKSYDNITDSAGNKLTLDSNNNLAQSMSFTRTGVQNIVSGHVTYGNWQQHGAINAVTLPAIPGYTMVTNN